MRPGDLPREELIELARKTIEEYRARGAEADVHFKWSCPCGERCMFEEPNTLFERGTCHACGGDHPVTHGGFMLAVKVPQPKEKE